MLHENCDTNENNGSKLLTKQKIVDEVIIYDMFFLWLFFYFSTTFSFELHYFCLINFKAYRRTNGL